MSKPRAFMIFACALGRFVWGAIDDLRLFLKDERDLIQSLGVLAAIIFSAAALYYSSRSAQSSQESARIAQSSLSYSEREFYLRNRPYLFLDKVDLGGKGKDTGGQVFPFSIKFTIHNPSQVPATRVDLETAISVGGVVYRTVNPQGAMGAGQTLSPVALINPVVLEALTNSNHRSVLYMRLTYFGVLGEKSAYTNEWRLTYDLEQSTFSGFVVDADDLNRKLFESDTGSSKPTISH